MKIDKVIVSCECGENKTVAFSKKITCRCGSTIDLAYQSYASHIRSGIDYLTGLGISKHLIDEIISERQFDSEELMIKYIVEYDNRTKQSKSTN